MGYIGGNHTAKLVKLPPFIFCGMYFLCSWFWENPRARWTRTQVGENGHQHTRKSPQLDKRRSSNFAPQ